MANKYKIKQHQTSINLNKNHLSKNQIDIRNESFEPKQIEKKCNTCNKIKSIHDFRKRTERHGKKGVWYDAKCKDCHARVRGTKEIGKLSFAKELFRKGFRRCSRCKEIKPLTEFYLNRAQHTGINHGCKVCGYTKK